MAQQHAKRLLVHRVIEKMKPIQSFDFLSPYCEWHQMDVSGMSGVSKSIPLYCASGMQSFAERSLII